MSNLYATVNTEAVGADQNAWPFGAVTLGRIQTEATSSGEDSWVSSFERTHEVVAYRRFPESSDYTRSDFVVGGLMTLT